MNQETCKRLFYSIVGPGLYIGQDVCVRFWVVDARKRFSSCACLVVAFFFMIFCNSVCFFSAERTPEISFAIFMTGQPCLMVMMPEVGKKSLDHVLILDWPFPGSGKNDRYKHQ